MNKETREHLSCLMDGELSADAGRFVARRMGSNEELCGTWQRYHLIRDCLRRPGEAIALTQLSVDLDVTERDVAVSGSGRRPGMPGWMRPLAGSAIAASVAVAAVLVAVNLQAPQGGPAVEPFASPNPANLTPVSQPASFNATSAANQRSLNRYVLRHNQVTGVMGQKGFVSWVPLVAPAAMQRIEQEDAPTDDAGAPVSETEEP